LSPRSRTRAAAEAGLKRSDIITALDGQTIDDAESLGYRLGTKPLGGTASLTVLRGGKTLTFPMKLMAAPETPARDQVKIKGRSPFTGVTAANINPALIEELSLSGVSDGVIVIDVDTNSIAENVGLQKTDVIIDINDVKIATTQDLVKATSGKAAYWRLILQRNGEQIRTIIEG
jgi:S1-C subfamily serine protease